MVHWGENCLDRYRDRYLELGEVYYNLVRYLEGTEFIEKNIQHVGPYRCDIYSAGFSGLGVLDNLDKSSGAFMPPHSRLLASIQRLGPLLFTLIVC